jgi:phage FluMu gp28-like protein
LYYKATVDSKQQFKLFIINWRDCPDLKEEVIRRLCPDPIAFSQEYENKFLGNIETEFPFDLLMKNVNSSLTYEEPLLSVNVWLGIDVGRKIDQTAILGCVKDGDKYKVVYKDVMSGIEYETQQRVIEMLMNTNQIVNVNIDETGIGNMLAENLSKRNSHLVRRYTFTAELKENLVINFKRLLIHNLVEMPDDAQLIQALHSIKRTFSSGGHLKFDADRTDLTGHADVAWAIMLACYDDNKSSDELVFYGLK